MSNYNGYLVRLRIVMRSHEHYGLLVWINHGDLQLLSYASSEAEAGEHAKEMVSRVSPGNVSVEHVLRVGGTTP